MTTKSKLRSAIKEAVEKAFEETMVKEFQHLTPLADRPKVECNHCWILWNKALEAVRMKQGEYLNNK